MILSRTFYGLRLVLFNLPNRTIRPTMEPVDQSVEVSRLQGIRLGQQANEIAALKQSMEACHSHLAQISNTLHQLQAATPVTAAPLAPPLQPVFGPSSLPRLSLPECYDGNPGKCRSFLSICSLIFGLQPSPFPTEQAKVAYVITLLTGRAHEWGTALWDAGAPECQNYTILPGYAWGF